ncbi:hypothetical protein [Streptomyces longisporoflavus]|uniref:Uncharacterized protein n=1 Tax=Streptomyces longisporoflavus TaxID=28044 RepID=A0ABW7R0Q8_9ACTN
MRLRFATVLLLLGALLGGTASAGAYAAAPRVVAAPTTHTTGASADSASVFTGTVSKAADEAQAKPKKKKKKSKGGVGLIIGIIAVIAVIIIVLYAVRRVRKARGGH